MEISRSFRYLERDTQLLDLRRDRESIDLSAKGHERVFTFLKRRRYPVSVSPLLKKTMLPIWLVTFISKITGEAIKSGVETAKSATEIPKNILETQKLGLEIEEMKQAAAKVEPVVVPATFEDVKQFDPKYKILRSAADALQSPVTVLLILSLFVFGAASMSSFISDAINAAFKNISTVPK
ncbi:MAG: hypothetical protein WAM85_21660 [Terracidiphilus sp.]